jgi:glutamine synthetase
MNGELALNANQVVAYLQKPASEFTKADIIRFVEDNNIRMINFMYPGGDGRLKTLNFVITNLDYLDTILTCGERVDGSSLFTFIEASSSDMYVIPRFRTAFVDPFAEIPTLTMLCSFIDKDGQPLESAPEHTLYKASKAFTKVTGMEFHAMGELEYYVIAPRHQYLSCNRPTWISRICSLCEDQRLPHEVYVVHRSGRRTYQIRTL